MTRETIAFDLSPFEPPRVRLPGTDSFIQVGISIPRSVAHAGARLGLALGYGASSSGPRHKFSGTLFALLAILVLARHEERDEVTLAEIASRAMLSSRGNELWRSARSLGIEMLRLIAPQPPGDPEEVWPSNSTALVQVRQRRSTIASVSAGPFRLNPRYSIDGDMFQLRALFASRGALALADNQHPSKQHISYIAARTQASVLAMGGNEAEALEMMTTALECAGPLPNRERAEALRIMAGLEMQLGWSQHARRHAHTLVALAKRLGDKVLLADAWHLRALIARQLCDFKDAVRFDQEALAVLDASPLRRTRNSMVLELQRSLGVSHSQAVRRAERVGRFVARGVCEDGRWRHATRLFRLAIEASLDRGNPADIAHSVMRLANHRLAQQHHTSEDEREIRNAAEHITAMSIPTRAIWDRETASAHLLRAGAQNAVPALTTLLACREQDESRGYRHQLRLIDDTLRRAGFTGVIPRVH